MKNAIIIMVFLIFVVVFGVNYASAQQNTVCCERTTSGAYCQNVPSVECASDSQQAPTACDSTSFCRAGTCYDSGEGTCLDNTPQLVCNNNGGVWSEESPAQCSLGCCVLGDQAAFVSLVRCKKLSAELGLQTNYKSDIKNELACISSVQTQEKGACVYEFEFENTCKFTTRGECEGSTGRLNGTKSPGTFYANKLCSAEELGTNCGLTRKTTLIPGKDEVYFVDSCGNPANIYDSSKVNDKEYWTNVKGKAESCNPFQSNALSTSCGNCNYLLGSFGRDEDIAGRSATYGDYICADLNCKNTQNGKDYKHGESWCVFNDKGSLGEGDNSVGSRFFKHICINGEEVLEACEDFRAEECLENVIESEGVEFSQAACRVNRWQDCTSQINALDCENTDRRDCIWKEGIKLGVHEQNETISGSCLPKNSPGLNFWEQGDSQNICSQGNSLCIVTFEKGFFGGESCVGDSCRCLEDEWVKERSEICVALGDCGPKINWIGEKGYKEGFNVTIGKPGDFGV